MPRAQAGFTLIEILIALVIVVTAYTALLLTANRAIHHYLQLEKKLSGHWIAQNIAAEIQLGLISPPNGPTSTMFLGDKWVWTMVNKDSFTELPNIQHMQITLFQENDAQHPLTEDIYFPTTVSQPVISQFKRGLGRQ